MTLMRVKSSPAARGLDCGLACIGLDGTTASRIGGTTIPAGLYVLTEATVGATSGATGVVTAAGRAGGADVIGADIGAGATLASTFAGTGSAFEAGAGGATGADCAAGETAEALA